MDAGVNSRTYHYVPIEQIKQHVASADSDRWCCGGRSEGEVKEEFNTYFDLSLRSDKIGQDLCVTSAFKSEISTGAPCH